MSKPLPVSPISRKQRFRQSLLARYFVRFHMSLILASTVGAGLLASRCLLRWGVDAPMLRYPLNVVISYAVFLILVRLWISYVNDEATHLDTALDVVDETGLPNMHFSGGGGRASSLPDVGLPDLDIGDGDGCAVLAVLAILVAVILGAGGYLIYTAPEILTEAAFDAMLASSLVKVTNRLERQGWVVSIVRGTALPFTIVLLVTIGLAYTMHRTCPMASTVREALACPESK
jgi:hypothetical protein